MMSTSGIHEHDCQWGRNGEDTEAVGAAAEEVNARTAERVVIVVMGWLRSNRKRHEVPLSLLRSVCPSWRDQVNRDLVTTARFGAPSTCWRPTPLQELVGHLEACGAERLLASFPSLTHMECHPEHAIAFLPRLTSLFLGVTSVLMTQCWTVDVTVWEALAALPRLLDLSFKVDQVYYDRAWKITDCQPLCALRLTGLTLSSPIAGEALPFICLASGLQGLTRLDVHGRFKSRQMENLPCLTGLRKLRLGLFVVSDSHLLLYVSSPTVPELPGSQYPHISRAWEVLSRCTQLEELELRLHRLQRLLIRGVTHYKHTLHGPGPPALRSLTVQGPGEMHALEISCPLPRLESLEVYKLDCLQLSGQLPALTSLQSAPLAARVSPSCPVLFKAPLPSAIRVLEISLARFNPPEPSSDVTDGDGAAWCDEGDLLRYHGDNLEELVVCGLAMESMATWQSLALPSLRSLDITGTGARKETAAVCCSMLLRLCSGSPHLKSLRIRDVPVEGCIQLPPLTELDLDLSPASGTCSMAPLTGQTGLQYLRLRGWHPNQVECAVLPALASLSRLNTLKLEYSPTTSPVQLQWLDRMQQLRSLTLNTFSHSCVPRLTGLECLTLSGCEDLRTLNGLEDMLPGLRRLSLMWLPHLEYVGECGGTLRRLEIYSCPRVNCIAPPLLMNLDEFVCEDRDVAPELAEVLSLWGGIRRS